MITEDDASDTRKFFFRRNTSQFIGGRSIRLWQNVFCAGIIAIATNLMDPPLFTIHYCYGAWEPMFETMQEEDCVLSQRITLSKRFEYMVRTTRGWGIRFWQLDGWRGKRQEHFGHVYQTFTSSEHRHVIFLGRFVSLRTVCQELLSQCPLHSPLQESLRLHLNGLKGGVLLAPPFSQNHKWPNLLIDKYL